MTYGAFWMQAREVVSALRHIGVGERIESRS
jgi:hypothetical protein